jgi:molecular chaperone DnaK (HSP70)
VELGIDLGTANTVISDVRRGIVLDEPSLLLLRRDGGRGERVVATGKDAAVTSRVWPFRTCSGVPVAGSHSRTVPSALAEASSSRSPTCTAHTPITVAVWPSRMVRSALRCACAQSPR